MDGEEWVDLFDDDSNDEDSIEPNPDDTDTALSQTEPSSSGTDCAPAPKRKKKSLNKRQKQQILGAVKQLDETQVSENISAIIMKQLHMQVYPERAQFFQLVTTTHKDVFIATCRHLMQLFCDTYSDCDKGKEKYIQFQVKWHKNSSRFLLDHTSSDVCNSSEDIDTTITESNDPQYTWRKISSSVSRETRNAVMLAIISAIYDHHLSFIFETYHSSKCTDSAVSNHISDVAASEEPDDVYFRFGGGALASMFQTRYKQMKSSKSHKAKEKISQELSVLKWMQMEIQDKGTLPESLKYRDQGYMYFPHRSLLPFIKKLDETVCKSANSDSFKRLGSKLIEVHVCI